MVVRNLISEGKAEPQIRRGFMNAALAINKLSQQDVWRELNDNTGTALTTGPKAEIFMRHAGYWTGWWVPAAQVGSIKIDVWKAALASYPPTNANTITAANEIAISGAQSAYDTTLTGWTVQFAAGSTFILNVDSCTTIQRATVYLGWERS